jgi:hypothetical protein
MPVVTVDFFRNFESPKKSLYLDPVGIQGFTERPETGPPKSFVPCVSARAPELRRPRFSFLYVQLVKEPETGSRPGVGGERAPHSSLKLRITDRRDQLKNLKVGSFFPVQQDLAEPQTPRFKPPYRPCQCLISIFSSSSACDFRPLDFSTRRVRRGDGFYIER